MGVYSADRRTELWLHTTALTDLKNKMLGAQFITEHNLCKLNNTYPNKPKTKQNPNF